MSLCLGMQIIKTGDKGNVLRSFYYILKFSRKYFYKTEAYGHGFCILEGV